MWAGSLFLADIYFEELNKHDVRKINAHYTLFGCCAVERHGVVFIATLIWFIPTSLVSYMKKEITVIYSNSEFNAGG